MSRPRVLEYGVPAPFDFEAPSSWIGRLALSQGCALEELLRFLDLPAAPDLDQTMHGAALAELRRKCSLPRRSFGIAGAVMAGFNKVGMSSWRLAFDSAGGPAFQYCPVCLRARTTPHFDIQWRFLDWRYCPLHNCLMESSCWRCRLPICYPRDMATSVAGRRGSASQRRCLNCTADLAAAKHCFVNPATSSTLTELEACWLANGRALLASLCSGRAQFRSAGIGTAELWRRAHREWLPLPHQWSALERRLRSDPMLEQPQQDIGRLHVRVDLRTPWGNVLKLDRS